MSLVYRPVSGGASWISSSLKTAAITCVSVTAWASEPPYNHIPPGADQIASAVPASDPSVASACAGLPTQAALKSALTAARHQSNGGFNLDMWGTVVNRDGVVCAVAFTGADRGSQWPGSRVISAQKANTANAFSLPHLSLATANLFSAVQPGGSLFGLQHSNPVDTGAAYQGPAADF